MSQDKIHTTDSNYTTENDFLKNLCFETSIAWSNSIDVRWIQLDDKVTSKVHVYVNFADIISLLQ